MYTYMLLKNVHNMRRMLEQPALVSWLCCVLRLDPRRELHACLSNAMKDSSFSVGVGIPTVGSYCNLRETILKNRAKLERFATLNRFRLVLEQGQATAQQLSKKQQAASSSQVRLA